MGFDNVERVSKALYVPIESIDMTMIIEVFSLRTTPTSEDRLAMKVSMVWSVFAEAEYDGSYRMKWQCPWVQKLIMKPGRESVFIAS